MELYALRHKKYKDRYLYWKAGDTATTTNLLLAASLSRDDLVSDLKWCKKHDRVSPVDTLTIREETVINGIEGTFISKEPLSARDFEIVKFRVVEE